MRAVITVIGQDRTGIIYRISEVLVKYNVNIEDINQTIMQEFFTMIMLVDLKSMSCDYPELKNALDDASKKLGMTVHIQHENIFNAMHQI